MAMLNSQRVYTLEYSPTKMMGKQRFEALAFHVLKRRGPEVPT